MFKPQKFHCWILLNFGFEPPYLEVLCHCPVTSCSRNSQWVATSGQFLRLPGKTARLDELTRDMMHGPMRGVESKNGWKKNMADFLRWLGPAQLGAIHLGCWSWSWWSCEALAPGHGSQNNKKRRSAASRLVDNGWRLGGADGSLCANQTTRQKVSSAVELVMVVIVDSSLPLSQQWKTSKDYSICLFVYIYIDIDIDI